MSIQTSREVFYDLVVLRFRFTHNVIHTRIHEARFVHQLNEGTASIMHVYAVYALAARFSDKPWLAEKPFHLRSCPSSSTDCHYSKPGSPALTGLVFIGYYYDGECDAKAKHLIIDLAKLLHAETLSLWNMLKDKSPIF
ncbi:C6 transcription factor, putative [Penicillium digitatum PHI26]|uniref:C6 transcription factor, putative n=2 Tax=Penicillium digitatum TaxID=36651 RepID=K9GD44_PEND2|nr:C6 transcription factor, putative [Penicillium digitatum Pd1]EKV19029.1 C6 transcription factor, putative [Penicillium digitatum PHI26]EKV21093.1 C6 transcription factor, putative [Penicillium digitatum Pd1]